MERQSPEYAAKNLVFQRRRFTAFPAERIVMHRFEIENRVERGVHFLRVFADGGLEDVERRLLFRVSGAGHAAQVE